MEEDWERLTEEAVEKPDHHPSKPLAENTNDDVLHADDTISNEGESLVFKSHRTLKSYTSKL